MGTAPAHEIGRPNDAFPPGGGEMGALIRDFDWSATPLGPISDWSPTLRTMVSFLLANRFPLLLWWGSSYIQLYNDAYRPVLGDKHFERALGQPVNRCWDEIWHILQPLIDTPFHGGPATWIEDFEVEIHRTGFTEESHFTVAYSPVPDEAAPRGIGGVLATVHEITGRVITERRVRLLRDLSARMAAASSRGESACAAAAAVLGAHPKDVPFALMYLSDGEGASLQLAAASGFPAGTDASAASWLAELPGAEAGVVIEGLAERLSVVPAGPWKDPPTRACILAIPSRKPHEPAGFLVAGLSSRLAWDEAYRGFLELVAAQIGAAVANERALAEERQRAEALAELDRAKSTFFSNVSHELRTPLTLLLGPIEAELQAGTGSRECLEMVQRNGQRLLKLVNTLLDFSALEAERLVAQLAPTDLAALTADLAGSFRPVVERAGLALEIDCPPLPQAVLVDCGMWEKIVLNLISNALKFTLAGTITVEVRWQGSGPELRVRDTGVGIPPDHVGRVFERFHRVPDQEGRTHEGTGIGLALVAELVRLHGGTVRVESEIGRGSSFYVNLPPGRADSVAPVALRPSSRAGGRASAFVHESEQWLGLPANSPSEAERNGGERILLVEDNDDMRTYVGRILREEGFRVLLAGDGRAGLELARRESPALVLSDVMMPRLDGFGLLRELRADPALATLPVILLSARAGEEAHTEGLDQGADDYLIKPFTARELVARVRAHLGLAELRRQALARVEASAKLLRAITDGASDLIFVKDREGRLIFVNKETRRVLGKPEAELLGSASEGHIPLREEARVIDANDQEVLTTGQAIVAEETFTGPEGTRIYLSTKAPLRDAAGAVVGVIGVSHDITERKAAEQRLQASEEFNRSLMDSSTDCVKLMTLDGRLLRLNGAGLCLLELDDATQIYGEKWQSLWPAEEAQKPVDALARAGRGETAAFVGFCPTKKGTAKWWDVRVSPVRDADGQITRLLSVSRDVTEHRQAQEALRLANRRKDEFLAMLAHELRNPLSSVVNAASLLREGTAGAEGSWAAEVIARQSGQLGRLVDDLLDVSRISRGQIELRLVPLDAAHALEGACEAVAPLISERRHTLVTDFPRGALWVRADPTRLEQIVGNLLANAARYTPPQGRITLAARLAGAWVQIEVTDTGTGLDPTRIPEMFELFVQGERSSARSEGGLGVGLTVVRGLCELHGGSVSAHSDGPGRGAKFTVSLPALEESTAAPSPSHEAQATHRRPTDGTRVLIVDDNTDAAEGLGRLLGRRGYDVEVVHDGASALRTVARFVPHVVLLDIGLPDMDGYEVCTRLRANPETARTLVAALSGYGRDEDRSRSRAAGFDQHLVKPVDIAELTALLNDTLAERSAAPPGQAG